ncbi:hypothetical protein BA953_24780 (plasmid) [Vibrio coralliilyticus]|nr:hypothetical protein BA953_24780 [Vibrio coralliilyticus]
MDIRTSVLGHPQLLVQSFEDRREGVITDVVSADFVLNRESSFAKPSTEIKLWNSYHNRRRKLKSGLSSQCPVPRRTEALLRLWFFQSSIFREHRLRSQPRVAGIGTRTRYVKFKVIMSPHLMADHAANGSFVGQSNRPRASTELYVGKP